jgi:hypothetical protein
MSFDIVDFDRDTLVPVHDKVVSGFGGTATPIEQQETIVWNIEDDDGVP